MLSRSRAFEQLYYDSEYSESENDESESDLSTSYTVSDRGEIEHICRECGYMPCLCEDFRRLSDSDSD